MLDADTITARRRYKRSISVWRLIAILSIVAAIVLVSLFSAGEGSGFAKYSDHIARVRVTGLITGKQATLDMLEEIEKSDRTKALIVHIDSPGGTTAGSEAIYEALRKVAAKKPVTSVLGTVAASGGYITAIATDHIVARGNTITGSIGVIFQWAEVTRLLDTLGIKMEEIKSSELKAEPNMFKPLTEKVRQVTQAMVQDSYQWFVDLVAKRRNFSSEQALKLSDGRVYTGRQAIKSKLIDAIGGEEQAINWLENSMKIAPDLKVIDWEAEEEGTTSAFGFAVLHYIASALGLEPLAASVHKTLQSRRAELDGLMSVWHPTQN